jgi:hypothetical protein
MTYSKIVITEAIKSTFLTLALFTLFDIAIQGYSNYHDWIISLYFATFGLYLFISKRFF